VVSSPAVPRNRRLRLVLAVLGGVLALLCLGGVGVTFVLYDDATKIDRGAPDTAVDNYLIAYLVKRDDVQAQLFICKSAPDLAAIARLRDELVRREREFDVQVGVSWGVLTRTPVRTGEEAVRTELTISGSANGQARSRRNEEWEFRAVDDDGWRVCGATKVS
jgi:hypothetical protein